MDLKSELRTALYGTATVPKIDPPETFTPFQKNYTKYYSQYSTNYEAQFSPTTLYVPLKNNPTIKRVLVKVNPKAVFPCDSVSWTTDDYNSFINTLTAWYMYNVNYRDISYVKSANYPDNPQYVIPAFALGLAPMIKMTRAQHISMIAYLNIAFNMDFSSYEPIISGTQYQFNADMVAKIKKIMLDYLTKNMETFYKYRLMSYTKAQADEYRALAKQYSVTYPLYIETGIDMSQEYRSQLHEYQALVQYVNMYRYTQIKLFPYKDFPLSTYKTITAPVVTTSTSYIDLETNQPKYMGFSSSITYLEDKVGTDIRALIDAPIELGKNIINARSIFYVTNFSFFNFLISLRDHYTKFQSTGFLFSGGDGVLLNAFKSGNIQTVLTSQLPMLGKDVITNKSFSGSTSTTASAIAFENLLKFLYISTMGYIKSGQVITTNLQPYFVVGDTQQAAFTRLCAVSPITNGVYLFPAWARNIIGSDIVAENTPSGVMVVKVINDILKEADAFLKNF